jgi:hypothetical protein
MLNIGNDAVSDYRHIPLSGATQANLAKNS